MKHPLNRLSLLSATLIMLAGCSAAADVKPTQRSAKEETFSAEEKRVARALSIGRINFRVDVTPKYKATLCNLALTTVEGRLQNAKIVSDQQLDAIAKANAIYRDRATAGLSTEERERIRKEVEAAYPDSRDRARFAIGCLQELVEIRSKN